MILKIARQILTLANTVTSCGMRTVMGLIGITGTRKRSTKAKSSPVIRLIKMPPRLTNRVPKFGPPRSFHGSTLTGFPQPRPTGPAATGKKARITHSSVPRGSICAGRLNLSRPSVRGVGSPNMVAIKL